MTTRRGPHDSIPLHAATASAQDADAAGLYQEANALYDAQKFPEAEAKYQAAWALR